MGKTGDGIMEKKLSGEERYKQQLIHKIILFLSITFREEIFIQQTYRSYTFNYKQYNNYNNYEL